MKLSHIGDVRIAKQKNRKDFSAFILCLIRSLNVIVPGSRWQVFTTYLNFEAGLIKRL